MATLLLAAGAGYLASSLGITGTILASVLGTVATAAGSLIDSYLIGSLFAPKALKQEGPRLQGNQLQTSQEGAAIVRLFGRVRIAGQVIWTTRFKEKKTTTTQGGKSSGGQKVETTTYTYSVSFAVGLCEGPILGIGQIWADNKPMDLSGVTYRLYKGTETQNPDAKHQAVEGTNFTPGYRGTAYIVFESLQLEKYGNRIPQINVEVYTRGMNSSGSEIENKIKGVTLIPGLSEFAYSTSRIIDTSTDPDADQLGWANYNSKGDRIINENDERPGVDFVNSVSNLKTIMTGVDTVSLVVAWHFTDLRVGLCECRPKVETSTKTTTPYVWKVSGIDRSSAQVVSQDSTGPLLGGAPADKSVYEAIQYLKSRGYLVTFYPFMVGDIKSGNTLVDPYDGYEGQPTFPWRGRITCDPSPYAHNYLTNTHDLSGWTIQGSITTGQTDPWGHTEAYRITDNSNSVTQAAISTIVGTTVATGTKIFAAFYVKQDLTGTHFANVRLHFDSSLTRYTQFYVDLVTGTFTVLNVGSTVTHSSGVDTITASDGSTWYRCWQISSHASVAYQLRMYIYPAMGTTYPTPTATAQASSTFAGVQIAVYSAKMRYYRNTSGSSVEPVDKTSVASTQVSSFFGACAVGDFGTWSGDTIPYTGPTEWTFRRMVLHYAKLCQQAGGVDNFLIGSEMVELNRIRSAAGTYPAVSKFITLATDVSSVLGSGTKVGYAADWSEYNSHRPDDGSDDVYFHLDPLWSSADIDFVGVDNYTPLSDWRDTPNHLDGEIYDSIYDLDYLQSNIEGGEGYDWYYTGAISRNNQVRTTITDGAYGKPWIYRQKDFKNWWLNLHYNRPAGVESGSHTSWVPQSKPIWFTEFGCPAVDKGTNQPNVFVDPKSSESEYPYYSTQARDPLIQRRYLEAVVGYWQNNANNPTSTQYSGHMVDTANMYVWTWDARPYPAYPKLGDGDAWRDGDNWALGHWLTGRMGMVSIAEIIKQLTANLPVSVDTSTLHGLVYGYNIERVMSAREAIEGLSLTFMFDAYESKGVVRFAHRDRKPSITILDAVLVDEGAEAGHYSVTRAQETELPLESSIQFIDALTSYEVASVLSRRSAVLESNRTAVSEVSAVMDRDEMQVKSDILLVDAWVQRERIGCVLPPSMLKLDPSDIVTFNLNGKTVDYRIEELGYEFTRSAKGARTDRSTYYRTVTASPRATKSKRLGLAPGVLDILDIPIITDTDRSYAPWLAVYASPWVSYNVLRSSTTSNYVQDTKVVAPATVGLVTVGIGTGIHGVWDYTNTLTVRMLSDDDILTSLDSLSVLGGSNSAAIKCSNGEWEIMQWLEATALGANTYALTGLLRGQLGTEGAMASGIPVNASFVVLENIQQSKITSAQYLVKQYWRFGPATRDIGDTTYRTVSYTPKGINLRPLAPSQLRAVRDSGGNITLSWIRRDRKNADNWELPDIPMSESAELYDIEIYNTAGTVVARTVTDNNSTSFNYTTGLQTTDHGGNITTVKFRVYQKSGVYGRGQGRTATIVT